MANEDVITIEQVADLVTLIVFIVCAAGLLIMFIGLVVQMVRGHSPIESRPPGAGKISLSKLQMYLWTLLIAFAWLYQLVRSPGEFPQLPNQALLLMGISGAAYLAAKPPRGASIADAAARPAGGGSAPNAPPPAAGGPSAAAGQQPANGEGKGSQDEGGA